MADERDTGGENKEELDGVNPITPSKEDVDYEEQEEESDEEPVVSVEADIDQLSADPEGMSDEQRRQLNQILSEQQERIAELAEQIALLSTRVAHSEPGLGVCSVCHGPVTLEQPEETDTPHRISCQRCGEVYHEY